MLSGSKKRREFRVVLRRTQRNDGEIQPGFPRTEKGKRRFKFNLRKRDAQNELCRETAYTTFGGSLQIKVFVDLGDEENKGDGDKTRIVEEPERKRVDAIIVTSRILLDKTDNDAQQEASHAILQKGREF